MKKTLFAFSVTVVVAIAVFLAIGLSGCDWFNSAVLGKPNKTELAEREKQRQDELNRLDSVYKAEAQKLANLEAKDAPAETTSDSGNKPYHVIVSCYEEQVNVDNMVKTLKDAGYTPHTLTIGSLTAVSTGSFDTEGQAMTAIEKIHDKELEFLDELDDDIWVYKK